MDPGRRRQATWIQSYTRGRQAALPGGGEGHPAVSVGHQVLVVACAFWMAPAGRLMYFCAVVWPWNRLDTW
jgi:hypothetical protein